MLGVTQSVDYVLFLAVMFFSRDVGLSRGVRVSRVVGCHVGLGVTRCWVSRGVGCVT